MLITAFKVARVSLGYSGASLDVTDCILHTVHVCSISRLDWRSLACNGLHALNLLIGARLPVLAVFFDCFRKDDLHIMNFSHTSK